MWRGSWKVAAALLCTAAVAFALGQRSSSTSARPETAPSVAAAPQRPVLIERTTGLDRDELRAIVREELSQHQAAAPRADAEVSEDAQAESAERQARRAEALAKASRVVERGIADGVWSIDEREALRTQLPALGEREIHAVLSPLFQAINAQRLTLDGPPI